MSGNELNEKKLVDQHLDMMLRMAFRYERQHKVQQMLDELEQAGNAYSAADARDAFALFLRKREQQEAQARRQARRSRTRRIVSRVIQVAACFILVMAIATPFAIANVDAIRGKVMELLIEVKDDHTELSFVEDMDAEFEVPSGWEGLYYPAYIPEGYEFVEIDDAVCQVQYCNADGKDIYFSEYTPATEVNLDSENAELSYVDVNGARALVIYKEEYDYTMITWGYEDKFFLVETQDTLDESLKIARSVRRI